MTDVQIRAVPPPEMVANLRADNIDGFPRARIR
jgi:nitrate/nitrite transport system substrate-binding protein